MGTLLILQAVILGVIEGLTEFIPVSSTAHLLIAGHLIRFADTALLGTLSIAIQSGAILAAVYFFWHTVWHHKHLIGKVVLAFLPTGIAGVLLYPIIKPLFENNLTIALALIIGGAALLFIRTQDEETPLAAISYRQALFIGCLQILSFIPGVSRAGATLIGGSIMKIPRTLIVPFSFLLAIPTILGASVVELRHAPTLAGAEWGLIGIGALTAFIVALFSIKFFIHILTKKPLAWFGWYRIIIGIVVLVLFL